MHPFLFKIPNPFTDGVIPIPAYGVIILSVYLLSGFYLAYAGKSRGVDKFAAWLIISELLAVGFLGAMLWDYAVSFFLRATDLGLGAIGYQTGLAWYGALIGAGIFGIWFIRYMDYSASEIMDILAPVFLIGYAIGRMGCLLGGCCYGKPTSLSWGIVYPEPILSHCAPGGIVLHPTPIYASVCAIVAAMLLFVFKRRLTITGQAFIAAIGLHSIGRVIEEFFRGDHDSIFLTLTLTQCWAIVLLAVVLWLLLFSKKYRFGQKKEPASPPSRIIPE